MVTRLKIKHITMKLLVDYLQDNSFSFKSFQIFMFEYVKETL